jgi:polyisoprenoid-binding protein YceI
MSRFLRTAACALAALAVVALAQPARSEVETFAIDTGHSDVSFKIRHLMSRVTGGFNEFSGQIELDRTDPSKGSVNFEIATTSIDTNHEKRDQHLRSGDFFAADSFPKITFVSKKVAAKSPTELTVSGDLTMRGVTKPVDLTVLVAGFGKDPWGNDRVGFEVTGKVNRKDYGILWNKGLDDGSTLLDDEVAIAINVEAVKQAPEGAHQ